MALMPHRTVRENVAFSLEVRGIPEAKRAQVAARAIEMVDLKGWDRKYPDELSGGMQQRVGLARVMQPYDAYVQAHGPQDTSTWPQGHPTDKLNTLVDLAVGTDHPILIAADGRTIGVVTKRALLRGIQGREEERAA